MASYVPLLPEVEGTGGEDAEETGAGDGDWMELIEEMTEMVMAGVDLGDEQGCAGLMGMLDEWTAQAAVGY